VASARPVRSIIVIAAPPAPVIVTCCPSSTAVAAWNCTVPKLSSGSTCRPVEGASSTHSAEERVEV